jgi:hypothetical protein
MAAEKEKPTMQHKIPSPEDLRACGVEHASTLLKGWMTSHPSTFHFLSHKWIYYGLTSEHNILNSVRNFTVKLKSLLLTI